MPAARPGNIDPGIIFLEGREKGKKMGFIILFSYGTKDLVLFISFDNIFLCGR